MRLFTTGLLSLFLCAAAFTGCSDDTNRNSDDDDDGGSGPSSSSVGGSGAGGDATTAAGGNGSTTTGTGAGGAFTCQTARENALQANDGVSSGEIIILDDNGGDREVFIDATAGGFQAASQNPWVYIDLDTMTRVAIDDFQSFDDGGWDLAVKRTSLRNNSMHSGAGNGGTAWLNGATFESVTLADAQSATLEQEVWFDGQCNYQTDAIGTLVTSFGTWYNYLGAGALVPLDGVFVVRAADGQSFYKLQILNYYANPDGSVDGPTSARYLVRVQAL
ncbi:MAG: HmuY family protein [Myxococcota bacterium]